MTGASPVGDRAGGADAPEPATQSQPEALLPSAARPNRYDADILRAAAAEVASACVEWDNGQSEPGEWIDDLIRCWHQWDDGYKLAKALEDRFGVDADMALAEALDGASHALWTAHEAAVRAWVSEHNISPGLAVGDRLTTRWGDGAIGSINADCAIYLFVPDAEQEKFARGGGYHLNYEDASAIETRQGEDPQGLRAQHESAVPTADAERLDP